MQLAAPLMSVLLLLVASVAQAQVARVTQFDWLAGCWGFDTKNGRYEETWSTPTANSIVGFSRRVDGDITREFEYMRIVTSGGGGFDYIAVSPELGERTFNSTVFRDHHLVFENPDIDYPTRIIYDYVPPDTLNARIEGTVKGQTMSMRFPMKRQSCP